MILSELLIIFVNKVLITQNQDKSVNVSNFTSYINIRIYPPFFRDEENKLRSRDINRNPQHFQHQVYPLMAGGEQLFKSDFLLNALVSRAVDPNLFQFKVHF